MSSYSSENKRIAKNTAFIYLRIFVTILVGLLTTRYVLKLLGVSDYGLYTVVGGILGLLGIVSGALSMTTTRYINYEMGKEDGDVNRIFNICQYMHLGLAILVLLLAESIGVYYVLNVLNVTPDKRGDAMFVFQVSTVVSCLGILNVPYSSLLLAFEKFGIEAAMSIFNTIFKLLVVVSLFYIPGNTLRYYAVGMSLITFITFVVYHYIAFKRWPYVVKIIKTPPIGEYRRMLAYTSYNMFSTVAIISRSQGSTLLVNYFFGTVVNGAFSVAYSIQQYVMTLVSNIDGAASPQIIQNLGKANLSRINSLVNNLGKISLLIMEIIIIPLFLEIDYVLQIWLGSVPEGASTFCRITLFIALVSSTSSGISQVINATEKIKWFKIQMGILYLLVLPVAFLLFRAGYPPSTILYLFILSDLLSRLIQLILLKTILNYDVIEFVKHAYVPPLKVFGIMLVYGFFYKQLVLEGFFFHVSGAIVSFLITVIVVYYVALSSDERKIVSNIVKMRIKR